MAIKGNAQAVGRREHDLVNEAKRVLPVDPFGGVVTEGNFTTVYQYDDSNHPIYVGKAQIGTAKSAAAWQIQKITWDESGNPTDFQWADGTDGFTKVWNSRTDYTYS